MDYAHIKQINEYRSKQAKKAYRTDLIAHTFAGCLLAGLSIIACCIESLI